jgi:uncharacterized membrane protein
MERASVIPSLYDRGRSAWQARRLQHDALMKSTAHINGHPIHPMLIPYPFAFLTGGTAFDVGAAITGRHEWSATARHLTRAGLGSALLAAVPGIVDYFGSVPKHTAAKRRATRHALVNVSALTCFAIAESQRTRTPSRTRLLFSLAGTGLLSIGGWLGGELIYHDRIAVQSETERKSLDGHARAAEAAAITSAM